MAPTIKTTISLIIIAASLGSAHSNPKPILQKRNFGVFLFESKAGFAQRTGEQSETYWSAWGQYLGKIQTSGLLRQGSALQELPNGFSVSQSTTKTAEPQISGFLVLEAEELGEVKKALEGCPAIAEGGKLEVREFLPMKAPSLASSATQMV